jgi:hypothetical protein
VRVDDRVRPPQPSRNVRHWQNGEMALRWTAAGMLEAEPQFRRIIGCRDLAKLTTVIDRELDQPTVLTPIEEAAIVVTVRPSHRDRRQEVPRRAGHPRTERAQGRGRKPLPPRTENGWFSSLLTQISVESSSRSSRRSLPR